MSADAACVAPGQAGTRNRIVTHLRADDTEWNADRDSLHILPLRHLPIETPTLQRARLIKNAHLQGAVEFFQDDTSGSGQLSVDDLCTEFNWDPKQPHPDFVVLKKLSRLPSYDVYSLRILLRHHGIPVNNVQALRLSPEKTRELTAYMTTFTRPLILQVFGEEDLSIQSFEHIIQLFQDPDVKKARQKLQTMANKLGIGIVEIPAFLEDYGDVFMSLSYYRQSLDKITPIITGFLDSLPALRENHQLKMDAGLMLTCRSIESTVNERLAGVSGRFENFDLSTKDMWNNISAERFGKLKELIKGYHTTIGGVLCALTVKMNAWARLFPSPEVGGPVKRAEFIMSQMKPGMERIQRIDDAAPMLAGLG